MSDVNKMETASLAAKLSQVAQANPGSYKPYAVNTVTQITSITTGVTIDAVAGVITTFAATAGAAGATPETFTVTNSSVLSGSLIVATIVDYAGTMATNGNPVIAIDTIADGSFKIIISNAHGANALNGALKIAFIVLG